MSASSGRRGSGSTHTTCMTHRSSSTTRTSSSSNNRSGNKRIHVGTAGEATTAAAVVAVQAAVVVVCNMVAYLITTSNVHGEKEGARALREELGHRRREKVSVTKRGDQPLPNLNLRRVL